MKKDDSIPTVKAELIQNNSELGIKVICYNEDTSVFLGGTYNLNTKNKKPYIGYSNRWFGDGEVGYDFDKRKIYAHFEPSRLLKIIGYSTPLIILGSHILYSIIK